MRLSGPLRDRFDLAVEMGDGRQEQLSGQDEPWAERTRSWSQSLMRARTILADRQDPPATWNVARRIQAYGLDGGAVAILEQARRPLGLSLRGVLRTCRLARTAAALDGLLTVSARHVRESLRYRHEALGCWRATEG